MLCSLYFAEREFIKYKAESIGPTFTPRGELPGLDQCLNRTSAIARVLLCLEGHMANMLSLTLAFPHIRLGYMLKAAGSN